MKKILSILLSVMLVASIIAVPVMAEEKTDPAIPVPVVDGENNPVYIWQEDFSDNTIEDATFSADSTHTTSMENGNLYIKSSSTSAKMSTINISNLLSGLSFDNTKGLVYEFTLNRTKTNNQFMIGIAGGDNIKYSAARLTFKSSTIYAYTDNYVGSSASGDFNYKTGDAIVENYDITGNKLNFIVEVNQDSTWSVWLNGTNVVNNQPVHYMSTSGLKKFGYFLIRTQAIDLELEVDDLKVYQSQPRPKDTVDNVLAKITDSTIGTVDETTNVITIDDDILVGSDILGDSTIAFESAKGNINNNGTVKFPLISTNDIVTVKVTNTYNGTTYIGSKSFDVTIPSNLSIGTASLSNFTAGQTATVTIPVTVKDTESDSIVTVVMAAYDSTGKELLAIGTSNNQTVTVDELSVSAILPANLPADATVKVFVLDSANTANPLTKVTVQ